jgi:hypothetical protein
MSEPLTFTFDDDGAIPNSRLPLLVSIAMRCRRTQRGSSVFSPPTGGRRRGVTGCIRSTISTARRMRCLGWRGARRPSCSAVRGGKC